MSDYCAVFAPAPPLDRDGIRRLARHACLELHRVEWLRAYVAPDGARMLAWYRARDAESVRLVLRQQGAVGTEVWPAAVTGDIEPTEIDRDCVAVEFEFDTPFDAEGPILAAIDATRVFVAPRGTRLVCVAEGDGEARVSARLRLAGLEPTRCGAASHSTRSRNSSRSAREARRLSDAGVAGR